MNLFLCSQKKNRCTRTCTFQSCCYGLFYNEYLFEGKCVCRFRTLYSAGSSMCRILDLMNKGREVVSNDQRSKLFEIFVLHTWSIQYARWSLYRHGDIWAGIQNLVVKLGIILLYIMCLYNYYIAILRPKRRSNN